jgi:hypothetical protein
MGQTVSSSSSDYYDLEKCEITEQNDPSLTPFYGNYEKNESTRRR